jgi:aryl-alcohol dehydrogenase-like predicted oxidoreductase
VKDYAPEKAAEVRDALEALVDEGKIRWYGWSTDNPVGARVFAQGKHCTAIQHTLNMAIYRPEILAVCEAHDLASVNRYPLGSGLLIGKFNLDATFPEDDFRHDWNLREGRTPEWLQCVETVRGAFAGDARTLVQIALGWIWARSERAIPIPGFKTVAQVKENIQAMEFGPLSSDQMKQIDEIFGRSASGTSS